MKRPYLPLFTRDWLDDTALRHCSEAARGLLADLMCLMHEGVPYGHLTNDRGEPLSDRYVAMRLHMTPIRLKKLVAELEKESRLHRTEAGLLYCRRMVNDEKLRLTRAEVGARGGNPALKKVNHSDNSPRIEIVNATRKPSLLDDFPKYQEAAIDAGLSGSEGDWRDAQFQWSQLDFEQKSEAIKGLRERKALGEFTDPQFRPLVHNYLKNKVWQRPIRASPVQNQQPKSYPRDMI